MPNAFIQSISPENIILNVFKYFYTIKTLKVVVSANNTLKYLPINVLHVQSVFEANCVFLHEVHWNSDYSYVSHSNTAHFKIVPFVEFLIKGLKDLDKKEYSVNCSSI